MSQEREALDSDVARLITKQRQLRGKQTELCNRIGGTDENRADLIDELETLANELSALKIEIDPPHRP